MPNTRKAAAAAKTPAPQPAVSQTSKLDQVIAALSQPKGATIPDLVDLTRWQEKSVRGFISGALKTKRKLNVTSTKADGVRTYRIEEPAA